jgi:hypothetical protein
LENWPILTTILTIKLQWSGHCGIGERLYDRPMNRTEHENGLPLTKSWCHSGERTITSTTRFHTQESRSR